MSLHLRYPLTTTNIDAISNASHKWPIRSIPAEQLLLYHSICRSSIMCTCGMPRLYVYALNWIPESARNWSLKKTWVSWQLMYAQHAGSVAFCSATSTSCFRTASYRYPEIRSVQGVRPLRAQPKKPEYALNQYAGTEARGPAPISPGSNVPAKGVLGNSRPVSGRNMAILGWEIAG